MNNTKKPKVAANLGVALMQLAHSPSAAAPKQTCDGGGGNQQYMCQGMGGLEPLLLQLEPAQGLASWCVCCLQEQHGHIYIKESNIGISAIPTTSL